MSSVQNGSFIAMMDTSATSSHVSCPSGRTPWGWMKSFISSDRCMAQKSLEKAE